MNIFTDPIFWKAIERVLLVVAGAYLGFLGYKLFLYGIASGRSSPNSQSQIVTALYSGVVPGLFFILVAGSVVVAMSLTGGPQRPTMRVPPAPAAVTHATDRADLLKQINLLKQAEKVHQDVIQGLRSQLTSAKTNNAMTQTVVEQMQQSLNTPRPDVDLNALYMQMTELNNVLTELQSENEALRTENAALRAQSNPQ